MTPENGPDKPTEGTRQPDAGTPPPAAPTHPQAGVAPFAGDLPDLGKEFRRRVFKRYGYPGVGVLLSLSAVGLVLWNWGHIRELPVISPVLDRLSRVPSPG